MDARVNPDLPADFPPDLPVLPDEPGGGGGGSPRTPPWWTFPAILFAVGLGVAIERLSMIVWLTDSPPWTKVVAGVLFLAVPLGAFGAGAVAFARAFEKNRSFR